MPTITETHESSGGIVFNGSLVLLVEVIAPYHEYIFPKGTTEPGESSEKTAVREVSEETGYSTRIIAPLNNLEYEFIVENTYVKKTVHYFVMVLEDATKIPEQKLQVGEYLRPVWVTIPEALDRLTHNNSKELLLQAVELYRDYATKRASFLSNVSSETK